MKASSPFSQMKTPLLIETAMRYAKMQKRLCIAVSDLEWWHHFALASLLEELANRLVIDEHILIYQDKEAESVRQ